MNLKEHFSKFKRNIIGDAQRIKTPFHDEIKIIYADWTASGRMYSKIEERLQAKFLPFVANTHTDTNDTGSVMTYSYHKAQEIIKKHVNANDKDVLISSNSGMTGVVNKFQRILGLKLHEKFKDRIELNKEERPVVFITHMEHHSNQTSWIETISDVEIVAPDENGLVCLKNFEEAIKKHEGRQLIAAITSCSNVTGIITPFMDIAALMHDYNGLCFVDFACSAPYVEINMHVEDESGKYLDAIYFSPHKFLGGPGTSGILVFNQKLYKNTIPDHPGGGTVDWTNPWGQHKYMDSIESREDGGTPPFLQTLKAAMCMQLKDEMGVKNIIEREKEILSIVWEKLKENNKIHVLAENEKSRLGILSFYIDGLHYNLGVKMLNDKFGIQTRGGCSCAGTYGHYLLNVTPEVSNNITFQINDGNCSLKPGWIRMSFHPTHTDEEIHYLIDAIIALSENYQEWATNYDLDLVKGSIKPKNLESSRALKEKIDHCFQESLV